MTNQQSGPVPRSTGLEIFCIAIGGLALLGAIGSALAFVLMLHSRTPMDPFTTVFILGIIIASAALGSICIALSSLLKMVARRIDQSELEQTLLQQLRATLTSASTVPMVAPVASPSSLLTHVHADDKHPDLTRGQILELLQHLRDAAMMDDAQRQQCAARHWAKRKEALVHLIERHMLSGDWCMARSRLDDLQALLPADTDVQTLGERLAAEHAARLGEDVTVARAQLRRLLNITAWQEAEEIVTSLEHKYPQDAQVQNLAADLAHEREKLERENRERLLSELADATDQRQWRRAITAAEDFVQRYPKDNVTERLQFDLATLRDNATAHDRKEQETLFKDLLKRQHYAEAENVAKALIEKYPTSPAAAELTRMLPRVEELHRQETLKRQLAGAAATD
jgi:hypothetical protein